MKTTQTRIVSLFCLVLLSALLFAGCARGTETPDVQFQLPIDFLFKDDQGNSTPNLLGTDIHYLGTAAQGSVFAGAREENASLVVVRFSGQDNFYSLKGLKIGNLQQVVCRVECDIQVALVEGSDILIDIRSINVNSVLATPKVIWPNPAQVAAAKQTQSAPAGSAATATPAATLAAGQATAPAPAAGSFECNYVMFKKGSKAQTLVPLKLRSSPELPANFNSNVISYIQAGEKVEVLSDSQGEWVNIKKDSGETGFSKQCTTLNGRFLQPGN